MEQLVKNRQALISRAGKIPPKIAYLIMDLKKAVIYYSGPRE
jgi:hypothetical protein